MMLNLNTHHSRHNSQYQTLRTAGSARRVRKTDVKALSVCPMMLNINIGHRLLSRRVARLSLNAVHGLRRAGSACSTDSSTVINFILLS
jgi:hypothetical protein